MQLPRLSPKLGIQGWRKKKLKDQGTGHRDREDLESMQKAYLKAVKFFLVLHCLIIES